MYLYNNTENELFFQGIPIATDTFLEIKPSLVLEYAKDESLQTAILNENIKLSFDGTSVLTVAAEKQAILLQYLPIDPVPSSFAADKLGTDQIVETETWTKVTSARRIWDKLGDYDITNDEFVIPANGIYNFDIQLRLKNLANVAEAELALFKRETPEDDYWFIISRRTGISGLGYVHLNGATQFDFYAGERYYLAIKLVKNDPELPITATIDENDDYTAWGLSWETTIS